MPILNYLIDSASFVPHAVCLLWRPDLLAMHGISDFLIAMAYLTIPVVIVKAARRRPDLVNTKVAWMFATFITACALSHLAGLFTLWFPYYGLQGLIKVGTALVSLYTAIQLARLLPALLTMPSREQLAERDSELILRAREAAESKKINEKLDEFAYLVAHDLRAPLRSLRTITEWIQEDFRNPDISEQQMAEHTRRLDSQAERMDALVRDLLEYSTIGQSNVVPEPTSLSEVVETAITLLHPPERFTITTEGDLPVVTLIRTEIELVIRNLLSNAIKHHDRDNGKITVRGLGWDSGHFTLEIEDDGPGIPEQYFKHIFEKFSKLKSKDKDPGSGMGLAAVTRALESSGSTISVRNRSQDRGSIFTLALRDMVAARTAEVA